MDDRPLLNQPIYDDQTDDKGVIKKRLPEDKQPDCE